MARTRSRDAQGRTCSTATTVPISSAPMHDISDVLNGGPGNDRVEARNGVVDTVDCGEEDGGAADADVAS